MKVCIPIAEDKGLESLPYEHFGSAPSFLLHDSDTGESRVVANHNEHHEHGTCHSMSALADEGVGAILVGGIGRRAFARLRAAGIRVFQAKEGTARENVEALRQGGLIEFTTESACHGRGHGSGHRHAHRHGHHGHHGHR